MSSITDQTTAGQPTENWQPPKRSTSQADHEKQVLRAQQLIQTEFNFIYSTEFELENADEQILCASDSDFTNRLAQKRAPTDVPTHFAHLWEVGLLTPTQEQHLFRRMNFRKFCANRLRSRLDPEQPNIAAMDEVDQHLQDAQLVRNYIVRANLRLVVSIARKFVNDLTTLDELTSDGNLILMKAVDRFDFSRGFRFSTYATHSVQREFYRRYTTGQRRRVREVLTNPELLFNSVEPRDDSKNQLQQDRQVTQLKKIMVHCLDARELEIVDLRFGLKADDGGQTLREVGEKLNISKERVRQLQTRAIEQIRKFAKFEVE